MVENMLKRSCYELQHYQKMYGVIFMILIHTLDALVTKLVFNSKRTKNTNFADKLKYHSTALLIGNTITFPSLLGFWEAFYKKVDFVS